MDIQFDARHPAGDNPEDDILARHMTIHELRLRVGVDESLGCVSIDIGGTDGIHSALLAPGDALDLAHRLIQACIRLRHAEPEAVGPLSSQFRSRGIHGEFAAQVTPCEN
jgi:hypothetical protein